MLVQVIFRRTIEGEISEAVELSRVPCEGESIAIGDECHMIRGAIIHYANPRKGAPVAEIRL